MAKIVNVYIVYDVDVWPRNPTNNFKFRNCLFGATNVAKNSYKEKYVYKGYGITFDSTAWWSFGNGTARNAIDFDVDNSLSSHVDNRKNNFLILGLGPTFGINRSFGSPEKKFSINFTTANTKFYLSLRYIANNSYLFVNGKKQLDLKLTIKLLTFLILFRKYI